MGLCASKTKQNERINTNSDMPRLNETNVVHLNQTMKPMESRASINLPAIQLGHKGDQKQITSTTNLEGDFSIAEKTLKIDKNMKKYNIDPATRNNRRKQTKIQQIISSSGDDETIFENIKRISKQLGQLDREKMIKALSMTKLFTSLTFEQKVNVTSQMFYCRTKNGNILFNQGDKASCFFFIDHGSVDLFENGVKIKTLNTGQWFGELALLYSQPRTVTVQTSTDCYLWALMRQNLRNSLQELNKTHFQENLELLKKVEQLNPLTEEQMGAIARTLYEKQYVNGDEVVKKGEKAQSMIVVKSGKAVADLGEEEKVYNKGDYFGSSALIEPGKRTFTLKVVTDTFVCLEITQKKLQNILGDKLEVILCQNNLRTIIDHDKYLKKFPEMEKEILLQSYTIKKFKDKDIVLNRGQKVDSLMAMVQGCLKYENSREIACKSGNVMGSNYIDTRNEQLMLDNVLMYKEGIVAYIPYTKVNEIMKDVMNTLPIQEEIIREKQKSMIDFKFADFKLISQIDVTASGLILLIKHNKDNKYYTLKTFSKQFIVKNKLEKVLLGYKKILELYRSPFLPEFLKSFKDHSYIYFLQTFIDGESLYDILIDLNFMNSNDARFYSANLILILESLHTKGIVLRDVNPARFTVDAEGYVHVNNLECSKKLENGLRTSTVVGSPHYVAPEMLKQQYGYDYSVDLWSLGICLYEFVCGKVPFSPNETDPMVIYETIVHGDDELTFPKFVKDEAFISLVHRLLSQYPERRLGGSYANLKAHAFFKGFHWNSLVKRQMKTPYCPRKEKFQAYQIEQKSDDMKIDLTHKLKDDYDPKIERIPGWDNDF